MKIHNFSAGTDVCSRNSLAAVGMHNGAATWGEFLQFYKKPNIVLLCGPEIKPLGTYPVELKTMST